MPFADENHRRAYVTRILGRLGPRAGQVITQWQIDRMGFFELLSRFGPTSQWGVVPPPPPLPDPPEGATVMPHKMVTCRSNPAEIKEHFIATLLTLKPQWYTPQGLQTCSLTTLEAEVRMHTQWDVRAQNALAQTWAPPSVVTQRPLVPTTGPLEHRGTTPLRPVQGDGWTPPTLTGHRGA